mmetsp:Transcript_36861/g.81988  ORF Transcript_36861/g.81988 Transcript_36861/m.81988 type:complete len:198 (-) Transcript_36861:800-1393(-)|eukprot:CAMPEP_0202901556 /NCGR_PEP_ID=MMETSP1392-20130828/14324_1 /ASSEMBLY_ACC=CAM_ASM_000868 /TAXON_ID=225041 /ORGANISM="Chlamydomonas chlamydogama, Strain SAG 11-48b" /LENGTH=197 /DNA_ID=CAMNT_0049588137 /DNA_START=36 /DNA_END=629 /DNA_ORIENTATION=-
MAFFGLTTLGPSEPIYEQTAPSQLYVYHQIPEEHYVETFDKYLIGSTSQIAITLEVDGDASVLRASLGDMLRELLGRQPRKHELEAWFTYMDFDRSSVLSRDEFLSCVKNLVEFSANPEMPKQYNSKDLQRAHWLRGVRVDYEPQRTLKAPLTTQQDIGWHTKKPTPATESHALNQTDVSLKEGRNLASYYGHFVCQ